MKKIFTFFLCLFAYIVVAQEVTILDKATNEPIAGVVAYNSAKSESVMSDLDGKIYLNGFAINELIVFQHISYIKLRRKKSDILSTIFLEHEAQDLDEIVISASKFEQSKREVPQKIISIKAEDVIFGNPQTSADLLESSGQVFVQKSQLGGGSPMIRGFSTNRLLISVDNVRMNNAIFRGGNVQNVISIDPFSVQNTEVILGAGSVIYGSDAIGGVMNFYTQKPQRSSTEDMQFNANIITRYATASNEQSGHVDINFGWKKWASFTSVSYTNFDDLKMGRYGPNDYLRPEYVETIDGMDVIQLNKDARIQKSTGYNQINFLEKLHYQADKTLSFDLGLHYSATSDYSRYDRLIRYRGDQLRSAEWNYGPQKWFLGNFQLTKLSSKSNLYDKLKLTTAYQNFQESRIDRDLNSDIRYERAENVDVLSANLDFENTLSETSKVFYGFEYLYNKVGSNGFETNINTNTSSTIASRYPDASTWQSAAAYLSYKYKPNRKFTFQSGVRYNHIEIRADLSENNLFYNFPFNNANVSTGAFTGTAGISWSPNELMQWKFNASSAFRAPNIDDVGKIFDSEPGSVVVPNVDLKPEYAYGAELGLSLNFDNVVVLDLATYYTYLDNALVRRDFTINGESEIMYDGELNKVQAIQNASKAWIYGFEAGVKISFSEYLKLKSQYSIVGGTEEETDGTEVPVRHAAPSFGNTHLTWEKNKFKCDAFVNYNGELSFYQLAPSEAEKDYIYATDENGNPYSPSWLTLNFRSQYQISEEISLTATLENITNQRYRTYSSGIAAPGTNLILAVKYSL
ncbi:MAG: TonB-dependent receptor [Bacteroidetes bacterium]|nr:MAG: TonB-dependent receptor [Bacteroidota bacterium]